MPFTIRFGPEDPLNCRFAISPLWETHAALRVLMYHRERLPHRSWVQRVLPVARGLPLAALRAVMSRRGYTPDFLFPAPEGPGATFDGEIARVRATDPARAHTEMAQALPYAQGAASDVCRALLRDPAAAVESLAAALAHGWEALVAPEWPGLRAVLDADIAFRSRRLADGGLARLFAELHPQVTWCEGTLRVDRPPQHLRTLRNGEGVTLVPSVFAWPNVSAGFDPPAPAALIYPARGIGELWAPAAPRPRHEALVRLVGANRSAVLAALDEPASTSALAARLGLAPSSVSAHLAALRGAGLLGSYRVRHQVLYERTRLGSALLAGGLPDGGPGGVRATEPGGPGEGFSPRRGSGRRCPPSR